MCRRTKPAANNDFLGSRDSGIYFLVGSKLDTVNRYIRTLQLSGEEVFEEYAAVIKNMFGHFITEQRHVHVYS